MTRLLLTEDDLQARVIDLAQLHGWRVAHFRAARTGRGWRTPVEGDPGFPDLVLARGGRVILAELKSDTGRVEDTQHAWLFALGKHGRLWRPRDWPAVRDELTFRASFTCPRCQRTSHNPGDVAEGYCGACHDWTGQPRKR